MPKPITKRERRRRVAEAWYRRILTTAFMRTLRISHDRRVILFQRTLDLDGTTIACNGIVRKRNASIPTAPINAALAKRLANIWGNVTYYELRDGGFFYDAYDSSNELETPDWYLRISLSTYVSPPFTLPGEYVDILLTMEETPCTLNSKTTCSPVEQAHHHSTRGSAARPSG